VAYDPAYVWETAVIIQDGLERMLERNEDVIYYLTLYNENYAHPPMPEGVRDGILKGLYPLSPAAGQDGPRAQLLGSGPILGEALRAQEILVERYGVAAQVWSATSYGELRRDALACDRWNRLHPGEPSRRPYLLETLGETEGPVVAASDSMKAVPDQIARWLPGRFHVLGTDGFGRSDTRAELRRFFEVSAEQIAATTLAALAREGKLEAKRVTEALEEMGIDTEAPDPARTAGGPVRVG
jgi:pyruvate dehydrogenase E1 component